MPNKLFRKLVIAVFLQTLIFTLAFLGYQSLNYGGLNLPSLLNDAVFLAILFGPAILAFNNSNWIKRILFSLACAPYNIALGLYLLAVVFNGRVMIRNRALRILCKAQRPIAEHEYSPHPPFGHPLPKERERDHSPQ